MGFDIFLQSPPGELLDRSIIEHAFANMIVGDPKSDFWNLHADDGEMYLANLFIGEGPSIDGFMVARPPWVPEFWDAIFDILRQTQSFLVWPAGGPGPIYCVANPDWQSYLPADLVESMGPPALVAAAEEIPKVIEASGA
jgi:hypothetical protein